jgi:hypothetical protein
MRLQARSRASYIGSQLEKMRCNITPDQVKTTTDQRRGLVLLVVHFVFMNECSFSFYGLLFATYFDFTSMPRARQGSFWGSYDHLCTPNIGEH